MKSSVVTIGLYDGVHVGHRSIINRVVKEAHKRAAISVVVTFDKHPVEVTGPGQAPCLLTDIKTKSELLRALGVDKIVIIPFSLKIAGLSPDRFLKEWIEPLTPEVILVGEDFRFGKGRTGDIKTLHDFSAAEGHETIAVRLTEVAGEKASSSLAREKIASGDITGAREILGRYPSYRGKVEKGEARGQTLGFPTANIRTTDQMCLPQTGVYAGRLEYVGQSRPAVINVGRAPTFGMRRQTVIEAYVLDFIGDLYGGEVKVEFCRRLRSERKFPDAVSLTRQISKDARQTRDMIR